MDINWTCHVETCIIQRRAFCTFVLSLMLTASARMCMRVTVVCVSATTLVPSYDVTATKRINLADRSSLHSEGFQLAGCTKTLSFPSYRLKMAALAVRKWKTSYNSGKEAFNEIVILKTFDIQRRLCWLVQLVARTSYAGARLVPDSQTTVTLLCMCAEC